MHSYLLKATLAFLFLHLSVNIFGQNEIAKQVESYSNPVEISLLTPIPTAFYPEFQNEVEEAVFYRLNINALRSILNSGSEFIQVPFQIGSESMNLRLYQFDLFTQDYTISNTTGVLDESQRNNKIFYHGTVEGVSNSLVALSVFEDHLILMISTDEGNFEVSEHGSLYAGYFDKHVKRKNDFVCHTDSSAGGEKRKRGASESNSQTGGCIEVYVECDYEAYQDNNSSTTDTEDWVAALWNEVAILYSNESIPISISEIFVWDTTDPYASISGIGNVLSEFGNQVRNNYNGRLAHLMSTRSLGGGVAWLGVLCNSYGGGSQHWGPYAVSSGLSTNVVVFPTYSWSVMVLSHEMGHNVGSQHTHDCVWGSNNDEQIDDCGPEYYNINNPSCYDPSNPILPSGGGTIMSYCHGGSVGINFNNGYGTQPGDLLRDEFNNAGCSTGDNCQVELVITCPSNYNGDYNCDPNEYDPSNTGQATASGGTGPLTITYSDFFNVNTDCTINISRTWTVTDDDGATETCSQSVIFNDNDGPSFTGCPNNIILTADNNCEAQAFWMNPTFSDNCNGQVVISSNFNPGDIFTAGTTVVNIIGTDDCGNQGICSFEVMVQDLIPPTLVSCAPDVTVQSNSNCEAVVTWADPVFMDNCPLNGGCIPPSGSVFGLGVTTVECFALDEGGNFASCSFTVTVIDNCSGGGCPTTLDVNDNPITDGLYQASSVLNSIGLVPNNGTVDFEAGDTINMNIDFEVEAGADFDAVIENCTTLDQTPSPDKKN